MGATRRIRKYQRGTDTVPAMLTPHEAVLMPIAADLVGRERIRQANAIGNQIQQTLTPQQLDMMQRNRDVDAEMRRRMAMNEMPKPVFGFAGGTDDVKDLLRETEDTFYGGGTAMPPRPTPTPTPAPRMYAYGTGDVYSPEDDPTQMTRTNAAGRARRRTGGGIIHVTPDSPVSSSRYIGQGGVDLGSQYDPTGMVKRLPKGAIGVQGYQNAAAFNRSLNGSQPQPGFGAPTSPMTHTQMAEDIARRNLTAAGSLLGEPAQSQQSIPPGFSGYVSPEDAASKGLQWTGGSTGWQPYVSPEQATEQNLQYTGGQPLGSRDATPEQTTHFLPPGFSTAVGSTGAPNSTPNDIHFLPPGFTTVQGVEGQNKQLQFQPPQKKQDEGYGSAYGF